MKDSNGEANISITTRHARGERCDRLRWVKNSQKPEGQSASRPLILEGTRQRIVDFG
jgi:hypothetical protein